MATDILSTSNQVFSWYLICTCVLVLKMMFLSPLTGRLRFKHGVFISPEDTPLKPKGKVKYDDPDVERVRRAHRNDMENIPIFLAAALAYMFTNPVPWIAINLFRLFTLARIAHTFVYAVVVIPQPTRAIVFFVGYIITGYMAVVTLIHFLVPF